MNAIQTSELTKYYKKNIFRKKIVKALDNVSLSVESGKIFGLLGPNGAGKTTFIKLLLSIAHPTFGSAKIFDCDISDYTIKNQIGYLPENFRFPDFLSAQEALICFGRLNDVPQNKLITQSNYLLELFGLKDWAKVKVRKFSKGMRQKLGIAQALMNEPKLLFLDEPTDGVDPIGRKDIHQILFSLKEQGVTIFINSHLLSEVEMICDRVAILNKGVVLKCGKTNELTTQKTIFIINLSTPLTTDVITQLQIRHFSLEINNTKIIATIKEQSELDAIVDILRNHKIGIEGLSQQKTSLEDYFMKIINGDIKK